MKKCHDYEVGSSVDHGVGSSDHFNKPKFIVEIFSPETIFFFLTLFRGGVTCFNKIICTFANVFFAENDKTLFNITNILKQKSMKKKEYERPTMQVVQLKQQPQLLAGSDVSATMDGEFEEIVI